MVSRNNSSGGQRQEMSAESDTVVVQVLRWFSFHPANSSTPSALFEGLNTRQQQNPLPYVGGNSQKVKVEEKRKPGRVEGEVGRE